MKTKSTIIKSLVLLIGATTITLAGINWAIAWAAWLAPVFLLYYFRRARRFDFVFFYLLLFVSGMLSQTGNNLFHLPAVDVFNGLSFCILYSVAYLADRFLYSKEMPFYYTLIFPSVAVLVEFVASFAIGTWGSVAHTQFDVKPLLQFSAIGGIFGVSFLVLWFAPVANRIIEDYDNRKKWLRGTLIYSAIICAILVYGSVRMLLHKPEGNTVKVAAILSDTDIHAVVKNEEAALKKLVDGSGSEIPAGLFSDSATIEIMMTRTREAINKGAKILLWNEAALILGQEQKKELVNKVSKFCTDENVYILMAFLESGINSEEKPFNNVDLLVAPDGEIVWEYKKSFLHPYAEAPIVNKGDSKLPYTDTEFGRLGTVICADLDMPHYLKQAGDANIDILLVPAFDWEGITPFHAEMAVVPGIQHGFSVVRANGKGLTTFTDYLGNSLASANSLTGGEKIVYAEVPIHSIRTIYSVLNDLVIYLALLYLIVIFLGHRFWKKQKSVSKI
ncbi:nitrilase-related carbon-nitrogen hydrolase [Draconibacterium sp. IB214405]|uniref:nitrilase-related carbon-nitrogen hydrolase n=1 Tax=Draconibacterium sp. IB214405 TaxID=3097352 RepID=UPI002A101003|nr:nitrilase-related carbon-nitrogen hydrolase [Draconibacterium sp. IB214405]MDX8340377.1 nitrilase-related carbon-nitrogen hydrolase [Draconibacterium sp. IB214405]